MVLLGSNKEQRDLCDTVRTVIHPPSVQSGCARPTIEPEEIGPK